MDLDSHTDGDTKLYLGSQDFYHKLSAAWSVSHVLDPHHLGGQDKKRKQWEHSLVQDSSLHVSGRKMTKGNNCIK